MKIFETHAHYDDEDFDIDRDTLLNEMLGTNGSIDYIINIGASMRGCRASIELAANYEKIYAAVGVHPEEVYELTDEDLDFLRTSVLTNPKVIAIGEIGYEYHYLSEDKKESERQKEQQKYWFKKQLELAKEVKVPVIIHSREACQDTLEILHNFYDKTSVNSGIIHCYSYSLEAMREFLSMGFYIGIGGVVTFKNAKKLVEVAANIPLDRLLLETDSPYMAPVPNRGKRNDSRNIIYVAEKIAEIRGMTPQEIIDISNRNARRLFGDVPFVSLIE